MLFKFRLLTIILLLLFSKTILAQKPLFVHYNVENGLNSDCIYRILQSSDGYVWFSTDNGLSRFDGVNFRNYTFEDGLPDVEVFDICEGLDKKIYGRTLNKKVFSIDQYNNIDTTILASLNNDIINFCIDKEETFYIQNNNFQISKVTETGTVSYLLDTAYFANKILATSYGIIVGTNLSSRVFKIYKNTIHLLQINLEKDTSFTRYQDLEIINDSILFGYSHHEYYLYDLKNEKLLKRQSFNIDNLVFSAEINEKKIYIGTERGLLIYNIDKDYNLKNLVNIICENEIVICIEALNNNSIIIGTAQNGIYWLKNENEFKMLNSEEYYVYQNIIKNNIGRLFATKRNSLLEDIERKKNISLMYIDPLAKVNFILNHGTKTYICKDDGLLEIKKNIGKIVFPGSYKNAILKEETVYLQGIYTIGKINNNKIKTIYISPQRILFIDVLDKSLLTLEEDSIKILSLESLSLIYGVKNTLIKRNCLINKINDSLLLVCNPIKNSFILNTKNLNLTHVEFENKISGFTHITVYKDRLLIKKEELLYIYKINSTTISKIVSISNPIFKRVNSVYFKDTSTIVFIYNGNIFESKINNYSSNKSVILSIDNIFVNQKKWTSDYNYLNYNNSSNTVLTIDIKTLNLYARKNIQFMYEIDKKNIFTTSTPIITITNLSPGKHSITIYAIDDNENKSNEITIHIYVKPRFFESNVFFILCILGFVLVTFGIAFIIIRRNNIKQKEKAAIHRSIADLRIRALRSQINPHFIFNCLFSVQSLINTNKNGNAVLYLNKFSRLLRSILENSDKKFIGLSTELQIIEDYIELEQFRFQKSFTYSITIDSSIDSVHIMIPSMVLQPFIENAIIHGILHIEKPGTISLHFEFEEKFLLVYITDNGPGRQATKPTLTPSYKTRSMGVEISLERLRLISGNTDISPITYEDLVDDVNNPAGTKVCIRLPYLYSGHKHNA